MIVRAAYGDSFGTLFRIAAGVAVVTLVAVLLVHEVPLRDTVELAPEAAVGGYAEAVAEQGLQNRLPAAPAAGATDPWGEKAHGPDPRSVHDVDASDDPAERKALAALDVLRAAQDRARTHVVRSSRTQSELVGLVDALEQRIDAVTVEFRGQLAGVRTRLAAKDPASVLGLAGDGGDSLRSYEYGLLLNSQQTADQVTRIARTEAERVLAEADDRVAELEQRIARLRQVEAELTRDLATTVRASV